MTKRIVRIGLLTGTALLVIAVVAAQWRGLLVQKDRVNAAVLPSGVYGMWCAGNSYLEDYFEVEGDLGDFSGQYLAAPRVDWSEAGVSTMVPWWMVGLCWAGLVVPGWMWARERAVRPGFPVEAVAGAAGLVRA